MTAPRLAAGAVPFAAVVVLSLVVLFTPASATPSTFPPGVDKAVHLALFAALAWTGRRAGLPGLGLAVGLIVYAVGSEVLQGVLPIGRSPDPLDVVADTVGVLVGLAAARRPART